MDLAFLAVGAALGYLWSRLRGARNELTPSKPAESADQGKAAPAATEQPTQPPAQAKKAEADKAKTEDPRQRQRKLLKGLEEPFDDADRGADLEAHPRFVELVDLLAQAPFTAEERSQWVTSQTTALSCAALAAMSKNGEQGYDGVARTSTRMGFMALHFALKHLSTCRDGEIAGLLLLRVREWWTEHPGTRAQLIAWMDRQHQAGVQPTLAATADADWELEERRGTLRMISHPLIDAFLRMLEGADKVRRGELELGRIGQPLPAEDELPIASITATKDDVDALLEVLTRDGNPCAVLVGEEGAGKTTLAHQALRQLMARGWEVIVATPAQLMAGQSYIGELEQRIENLVLGLAKERTIWFVPHCHQLLETGSHSSNPRGILDLLLPHLERGQIQLLGESTPAAWARVLSKRPRLEALLQSLRVEGLSDADALALAIDWGQRWQHKLDLAVLTPAIAEEAALLSRQQFPERAEPGRILSLLKEALANALREQPPALPLSRDQLLAALARGSGLPLEVLDAARPLNVPALREEFCRSVIGQEEAVDCLLDRISMLKAGLTDPRRPIGVFLFAGPTGTGKTELAKTLARYLFGGSERMLRIDMSEYQSDDAYWRLIDDGAQGRSSSLTTRIRQNPFSVVLLDEFEKAHPRIWDLFLQVFDDGRLTDRSGNTADFRHAIILLTSNLGSTISSDGGMGFVAQRGGFDREAVERTIKQTFRPEFINRLDRVVIFNPLTRALMRDILEKELRGVLSRRGFRSRDWAVEWEPSAVEFLLDKGFTTDLGARPLRRAIDQHLLAPLARTMVEHRAPDGEQFLFVHGDGDALRVRFVDPDADQPKPSSDQGEATALRALALDPRSDDAALAALQQRLAQVQTQIDNEHWQDLKESAAQAMQAADFWQRAERTAVLDRLERIDRIEAGLRSADSLLQRLQRSAGRGALDLVRRVALLILSIDAAIAALLANQPEDALLELRPADPRSAATLAWRDQLEQMYLNWAKGRGYRVQRQRADTDEGVITLAISGYAALQRLRAEDGLHLLDERADNGERRQKVQVRVHGDAEDTAADDSTHETRVCRRYEEKPTPLVRDHVRGWRSGRWDRVMAGDFDLLGEGEA